MALNLNTLTSSATSGDVLAEALTTADFLEPVPVLRNLARGSQKGGDAKQSVSLNQPRALPLIKNPSGNLGGYLYIPNVTGNYATGPSVTIGSNQTWQAEVDMVITQFQDHIIPFGAGPWNAPSSSTTPGFGLFFANNANVYVFSKAVYGSALSGVVLGQPFTVKYGFDGTNVFCDINAVRKVTQTATGQSGSITHPLQIAQQAGITHAGNYAIQKAKLTVNSAVVFDCDFNGSTSIRHGDTKFNCVGGPVSLTRAGQDPVTVVKKDILRFDGANDFMEGLLNQAVTGVHFFASFSVLGNGGESYGRILGLNPTGGVDYGGGGVAFRRNSDSSTPDLMIRYNANNITTHSNFFDEERGDYLLDVKALSGSQKSKVNNADLKTGSVSGNLNAAGFSIASLTGGGPHEAALDLEFLALFPATITDDQADSVRNYINNRNLVFDLKDGFGYYFYDGTKAPVGAISSGSSAWNGRIVGSDNGDADKLATQSTANDSPVGNGYTVTFADNSDHLDIPSTTQAGWQIVGTSLGTFAYRVDNDAVTELNLLGNLGVAAYRRTGDLYGVMLLPDSASSSDIESARKLLIDRGSLDGSLSASYFAAWIGRNDIVEFKSVDLSSPTSVESAWQSCGSLTTFPALNLNSATNVAYAWFLCSSLNNFGAIDARNASIFLNTWRGCTALTSFPAGAKLGTEATNVNFSSAFRFSGLTSFPALDLNNGNNFVLAFDACSNLTSLETGISFSANATNIAFYGAFLNCTSLVDFPPGAFDGFGTPANDCFLNAWLGCSALSATSVENILVSIDTSGQSAPSSGPQITISYNVATGTPAYSTLASLKSKGWVIVVNNVTL